MGAESKYPSLRSSVQHFPPTDPKTREQAFDWYARLHHGTRQQVQWLWPYFEQWLAKRSDHRPAFDWVEHITKEARELAMDCESDA